MQRVALDEETRERLLYQWRRLQLAEHGDREHIPDRKEAELIHRRINDILDRRKRPVEVKSDGTIVWSDEVSPWIADQGGFLPAGESIAVNATGQAEVVSSADAEPTPKETP